MNNVYSEKRKETFFSPSVLFFAFFILLLDILTKAWVNSHLSLVTSFFNWYPYGGIPVFDDFFGIQFSINHITNTGAAWGFFGSHPLPLVILRVLLIFALNLHLFFFNKKRAWVMPLLMISIGATGNVIDFMLYGHVIDMFHFVFWGYDFPVFNVADASISLGVFWLFILSYWEAD